MCTASSLIRWDGGVISVSSKIGSLVPSAKSRREVGWSSIFQEWADLWGRGKCLKYCGQLQRVRDIAYIPKLEAIKECV